MTNKKVNMNVEVRDAVKVLKDFGIHVTAREKIEWRTWSPIRLSIHVKTLIKKKLGVD